MKNTLMLMRSGVSVCGVRGAACVACGVALVLLLLQTLPAAPPRPAPPRPAPRAAPNATAAPAPPPTPNATAAAPPPPPPPPPHPPGVLLTRDLYESGHARAHPELCPALGARLRLAVLVASAPAHARERQAIRLTWGHFGQRKDIALAFMLGAPPAALRDAIDAEDALYGDVVLGRSVDSYSNLTLKTVSMLEWWDTYCPRAPRLLKTDDDMFINVPRLLRFMESRQAAARTIWGRVVKRSPPKRTTKSKYYVPPQQFPGRVFPDFATGPAYLLTRDVIGPLLRAAGPARYVRLEDVFVTGVLAAALNVTRVNAGEFLNRRLPPRACALQRAAAVHMVRYHEQFDLWRKLLDGRTVCPD